jgi:LytS/YehU family sensor histidine kinase
VTHGIAGAVDGGSLSLAARERGGRLEITVGNSFDPDQPRRAGHGVGLDNVRTRLATYYPGAARADVREDGERYVVTIQMPAVRSGSGVIASAPGAAS